MSCNDWKAYKLEDITINITDGKHGNCVDEENSGYYFISAKDINEGSINYKNARQITKSDYEDVHKRTKLELDDVLITNSGTIGKMAIITEKDKVNSTTFQKSVAIIKPIKSLVSPKFLYYNLNFNIRYLINLAGGSVQKNLLLKDLRNLKLNIPSIEEQEKIASILSSLDDKIELNNEMNKTLEEMAQSIFKRWFVDFEFPNEDGQPYKSSGGDMVDSELGRIPKGWEVKTLGDTDIVIEDGDRGKNYPKKSELLKSGYCPFLNNKNIIDDKISLVDSDFITEERHNLLRKGTININDIILTTRGSVGNIGIFNKYLGYEFARINSGMIIIKNKEDFNLMYLYQLLKTPLMKEQYKSMSTGTAQPQLPIKDIKKLKILKPDKSIQDKIGNLLSSIYDLVFSNDQESLNISIKRDLLLPKLMSGEISVN